jgi:nucleoside-diphosphate-sugar epimerase
MIDAYMLLMQKKKIGTYNVGTYSYGTLREALENIIKYAGKNSKVVSLPTKLSIYSLKLLDIFGLSPLAPWHYLTYHMPYYFDVTELLALGWKPRYSNDMMFQESYDWFINNYCELEYITKNLSSPHRSVIKQGILKILKAIS